MNPSRREFLSLSAAAVATTCVPNAFGAEQDAVPLADRLKQIEGSAMLQVDFGERPMIIDRIR